MTLRNHKTLPKKGAKLMHKQRWENIPPELHAEADRLFSWLISKPNAQRDLREGKPWRIGLTVATVTNMLLHPADAKVMKHVKAVGLGRRTGRLIKAGLHKPWLFRKKRLAKAGETKQLSID